MRMIRDSTREIFLSTVGEMSREYVLQPFRAPLHLQIDYARELNEQQLRR